MKIDEKKRDKIIKEIADKNPRIIIIKGSLNPTYSSDSISYCLVHLDNGLVQFSGCSLTHYESETKFIEKTKFEWLKDIILEFENYSEMSIIKDKEDYYIFNSQDKSIEEYYYKGELIVEYGAYIELIQ